MKPLLRVCTVAVFLTALVSHLGSSADGQEVHAPVFGSESPSGTPIPNDPVHVPDHTGPASAPVTHVPDHTGPAAPVPEHTGPIAHTTNPNMASGSHDVRVNRFEFDGEIVDLKWVTHQKQTVFALTEHGSVYRSKDEGKTWTAQADVMVGAHNEVISMITNPTDDHKVFFLGRGLTHWVTTNAGQSYTKITDYNFHDWKWCPSRPGYALASAYSPGCDDPEKGSCYNTVYLTKKSGDHDFVQLETHVHQFDWGERGFWPFIFSAFRHRRMPHLFEPPIYMTIDSNKKETDYRMAQLWDTDLNFVVSHDLWKTHHVVLKHGNLFLHYGPFLFIAKASHEFPGRAELYVQRGPSHPMKAHIGAHIHHHNFNIVDSSEGSVFIHVNNGDENTGHGDLYTSDLSGTNFALSLQRNRRSIHDNRCDFEKIGGIQGIYIANTVDNLSHGLDTGEIQDSVTQTRITFNKGGKWAPLKAPLKDSNGQDTHCNEHEGCHLHLHGLTSWVAPVYTQKNAPGLILSLGNVGSHLRHDETSLFFSRDAGVTWYEIIKGKHIYEYGNHGALMVLVEQDKAVNELLYSWDEGLHWKHFKFTDKPFEVFNVIGEPDATSQQFIVYGYDTQNDHGVAVHVDFSSLHQRECGPQDYEKWKAVDPLNEHQCLLGQKIEYTRRKQEAECHIPQRFQRARSVEHCDCTEEDWECTFGHRRDHEGKCMRIVSDGILETPNPKPPHHCPAGHTVYLDTGYRRIPGDTCRKGVDHMMIKYHCPGFFGGHHFWYFVLAILMIIGGYYCYTHRESVIDWVATMGTGSGTPYFPKVRYGGLETRPETAVENEFGIDEDDDAEAFPLSGSQSLRSVRDDNHDPNSEKSSLLG